VQRAVAFHGALEQVHGPRTEESGHKRVVRVVVQRFVRPYLLNAAVAHHCYAVAQRHRLDLVVRHVKRGDGEPVEEAANLDAGLRAELGIQVGQRLVEQEQLGIAHQRAGDGEALLLAAGERARLAVEQLTEAEAHDLRGDADALLGLSVGRAAHLEEETEVAAALEVGIERVVLEDHADVAILHRHLAHVLFTVVDFAGVAGVQPRDDAQQGALAAAGRSDYGQRLAIRNGQGDVVERLDASAGCGPVDLRLGRHPVREGAIVLLAGLPARPASCAVKPAGGVVGARYIDESDFSH